MHSIARQKNHMQTTSSTRDESSSYNIKLSEHDQNCLLVTGPWTELAAFALHQSPTDETDRDAVCLITRHRRRRHLVGDPVVWPSLIGLYTRFGDPIRDRRL